MEGVCGRALQMDGRSSQGMLPLWLAMGRIQFWKDIWIGMEALCIRFLNVFSLTVDLDAVLADYVNVLGGLVLATNG